MRTPDSSNPISWRFALQKWSMLWQNVNSVPAIRVRPEDCSIVCANEITLSRLGRQPYMLLKEMPLSPSRSFSTNGDANFSLKAVVAQILSASESSIPVNGGIKKLMQMLTPLSSQSPEKLSIPTITSNRTPGIDSFSPLSPFSLLISIFLRKNAISTLTLL